MKNTFKTLAAGIVALTLLFTGCKKDAGPTGPAGKNGTANIQSYTVTTNNLSWTFNSTDNSYNSTIAISAIDASVLNTGTIQVFIGDGTSTEWAALPFSYSTIQYNYSYKVGQVILSVTLSTGVAPNNPGGQQFKVVVIPPAMKKAGINHSSYSELKAVYTLKD